ncbi:hypothetical protein J4E86_011020 [Alternaria arbusti]|uniref:uncharacterized protein n=1 Tax=Alternaria arbusti TaxID=232088 RepID=UPI00221F1666|nr:uncharacterized protein J4E86_011020 [Alternaria arbusti]KAI4940386.1 hypothetical protein J4E86_011020 [Alternaria arbusti]
MFERSNKTEYEYLDSRIRQTQTTQGGDIEWTLPKHLEHDPKSNEIVRRAKRWLPTVASVRSVVMPIAALDPHKIAPICCAIVLAIPELAANGPNTEYRSKALDAYFEAANTINDWISFEKIFEVERENVVSNLKNQLPNVYIMALRLMCHVHYALDKLSDGSKADRVKAKAAAMIKNDPAMWDEKIKELKRVGEKLNGEKKRMNDKIAADEKGAAALKWFKKKDDPEDALSKIEKEITSDGRSNQYAQWFLDSSQYKTWFEALRRQGDDDVQFQAPSSARILWISGPFGMGKTTLAHRVLLSLKALESIPVPGESLRVVHYFCSARGSLRPDHETVIRSLILKLSWGLDRSIAPKAYQFYCKWTRGPEDEPSIDDWKSLLVALIAKSDQPTKLVILVDGLDAFEKTEEGQLFLESTKSIVKDHSHVFFVFSSHQHVLDSSEYEESLLIEYKVNPEDTRRDLEAFVDAAIEARAPVPGKTMDDKIGPSNQVRKNSVIQ